MKNPLSVVAFILFGLLFIRLIAIALASGISLPSVLLLIVVGIVISKILS